MKGSKVWEYDGRNGTTVAGCFRRPDTIYRAKWVLFGTECPATATLTFAMSQFMMRNANNRIKTQCLRVKLLETIGIHTV